MNISKREFLIRQPYFPEVKESDIYYYGLALRIAETMREADPAQVYSDGLIEQSAINFAGYMQDIVSDAGIWRSFVTGCRQLYGFTVPFHTAGEDYVDFELNREDVRFLAWYFFAMLTDSHSFDSPHDPHLLEVADAVYSLLDSEYDEAPVPEEYGIAFGLEYNDPDDRDAIVALGHWLFTSCYLITPAFARDLAGILDSPEVKGKDGDIAMTKKLEEAMLECPTGPLALFTPEWVYLMLNGKLPSEKTPGGDRPHKFYKQFVDATGGEEIRFFDSYEAMNRFLIEGMGWEAGKRHLEMAADSRDFILLVNKEKGMLLARDVARCFNAPGNPCYDKEYARAHAFECIAVRGRCPADLVKYAAPKGWLSDAVFPGTDDTLIVADNLDFLARCYLQLYYRD